ncbi:PREDICTED: uncharacterized protein At3g43530-like [Camelina sativa]|uniref:Uncharacterized protein At3g43530-like n=1 Tax=Camelina sativa TaxID=90675 RepID=A0ABM1QGI6_CAMSA|nr:PREDICTED: uncharacterized protein At3g43530-like [Camelina sativa]
MVCSRFLYSFGVFSKAIPLLGNKFIEEIHEADENCHRMCRRRFKKTGKKGFPLEKINDKPCTTTEIASVIASIDEEIPLLKGIMEEAEEDDTHDVVVASWMRHLRRGLSVSFEEMYTSNVASW